MTSRWNPFGESVKRSQRISFSGLLDYPKRTFVHFLDLAPGIAADLEV